MRETNNNQQIVNNDNIYITDQFINTKTVDDYKIKMKLIARQIINKFYMDNK